MKFLLSLLLVMASCGACTAQFFDEGPELISSQPVPELLVSWNVATNAAGYELGYGLSTNFTWFIQTTNTTVAFSPPGGFEYYFGVRAWNYLRPPAPSNRYKWYGPWSTNITIVAPISNNAPQMIVLSNEWKVMCQCSNGGVLLSTTNMSNWITNGLVPTNLPALYQGPVAPRQFFRSVEH